MRKILFYLLLFKKALYFFCYPIAASSKCLRAVRYSMENYLIFQPAKLRAVRVRKKLLKKFIPQRFCTKDGARLYAWFIPPKEGSPVILHLHGQAESILSHQDVTEYAISQGLGLFQLSYRGHYKSWGRPSEKGVYKDAQAALKQLEKLGYKTEDVIVWGHSLGTTVAVETAKNNVVRALILQSPIKNIKSAAVDISKFYFKKMHLYWLRHLCNSLISRTNFLQKFDNISKISKVKCPILILHSKADRVSPYYNSMALVNANDKAVLHMAENGSHWDSSWCFKKVSEFIGTLICC